MRKVITESQLRQIVAESVKKLLKEGYYSGGEYYEDPEEMYIGRTAAYYDDEDDSVYAPDYWTYSEDPNDKEFAGDIYALNSDGISELQWWIQSQRMNSYQRRNSFNPNTKSPEEMWTYLTNPQNNLSKRIS